MKYRKIVALLALPASLMMLSAPAAAKDCIRGAAAGGVAGRLAGRHTVMGAAAGCVAGRYYYKNKARKSARATAGR
jgi:hypothetical protein